MENIHYISELRAALAAVRRLRKTVALVPTMGNLHNGHLTLVDKAKNEADIVVVSIFVNPLQFDRPDDLARYPRSLAQDCHYLADHHTDIVFIPTVEQIYPCGSDSHSFVEEPILSAQLEGAQRPGHFRGVTTVISKLFNLIQPDTALFGEKDFQQLAIIRKLVQDMDYDIHVIGVPTVRAPDGLALSSRNNYLSQAERLNAPQLNQILQTAALQLAEDSTLSPLLVVEMEQKIIKAGFRPDGIAIVDAASLLPLTIGSQRAVILVAAWLGNTRLIDNQQVWLNSSGSEI